jgi:hypothetical protein
MTYESTQDPIVTPSHPRVEPEPDGESPYRDEGTQYRHEYDNSSGSWPSIRPVSLLRHARATRFSRVELQRKK